MNVPQGVRRLFWNPIIEREMKSRMRSRRAGITITLFVLMTALVGFTTFASVARAPGALAPFVAGTRTGRTIFRGVEWWDLFLVVLIAPALTAGAISGERERQTLDLLLVTRMRPAWIISGKFFSSIAFACILIGATLPFFAMASFFGGMQGWEIAAAATVLLVTALVLSALGLLASSVGRSTGASTFASYALAFGYFIVPVLVLIMVSVGFHWLLPDTAFKSVTVLNPFLAAFESGPSTAASQCQRLADGTMHCFRGGLPSATGQSPFGLFAQWRPWESFAVINVVFVVGILAVATFILSRRMGRTPRPPLANPEPPAAGAVAA